MLVSSVALLAGLSLTACNSGSMTDGLRPQTTASTLTGQPKPQPSASVGSTSADSQTTAFSATSSATPAQSATDTASMSSATTQVASLPKSDPVAFLPVTGAPQSVVARLASSMRSAAKSNALPIVGSIDQGAKYQIKGYFSALNDRSGTTLVYVWDILDRSGARVHRISGQVKGPASNGDPWNAVSSDMIGNVANSTVAELNKWIGNRRAG
ncbi:MAG: hypothetical protein JJ992_18900 [Planctomycetes bacterium]|nr:hypothetical protein [Planctomycetota bacterium]